MTQQSTSPVSRFAPDTWQSRTARRLAEILSHDELRRLLGPTRYRLHVARSDLANGKLALAEAMVSKHGTALFASAGVRAVVARVCGLKTVRRWHPGKGAATEFAKAAGFDDVLAGTARSEALPDFIHIDPAVKLPSLETFQEGVLASVVAVLASSGGRAMVEMPTGAGKTRVAVESLHRYFNQTADGSPSVLWITHREELAEQAIRCFERVWRNLPGRVPLRLRRFWGDYSPLSEPGTCACGDGLNVFVGTTQRALDSLGREQAGDLATTLRAVVIDEAHRSAAPTYRMILAHLPAVPVVGLTATAFRKEYDLHNPDEGTRELAGIFGERLIEPFGTEGPVEGHRLYVRSRLQAEQVLAYPRCVDIRTGTVVRLPTSENEVDIDRDLAGATDLPRRRAAIVLRMLDELRTPSTRMLYFGPTVNDAMEMATLLRDRGIMAESVDGETAPGDRRRLIEDFRAGRIQVLCNCELLTTGFDDPRITHVVLARPTVSQVLYEQMVGRGLRGPKFGGTATCVVMDCIDSYTGHRPTLAYEGFRELWLPATAAQLRRVA